MIAPATSSSSPAVTAVIICMTIMAICAVLYFAIRYYFEERRWKASAAMCNCLPPGASATLNTIECANICRYNEVFPLTSAHEMLRNNQWLKYRNES